MNTPSGNQVVDTTACGTIDTATPSALRTARRPLMQLRTSYFPITYFSSNSLAELLCPISSKSSVASLPAIATRQPLEHRQTHLRGNTSSEGGLPVLERMISKPPLRRRASFSNRSKHSMASTGCKPAKAQVGVVLTGARPGTLLHRVRALRATPDVREPRNAFGTQRGAYAGLQAQQSARAPAVALLGCQTPVLPGHRQAKEDNHTSTRPTPQTSSVASTTEHHAP